MHDCSDRQSSVANHITDQWWKVSPRDPSSDNIDMPWLTMKVVYIYTVLTLTIDPTKLSLLFQAGLSRKVVLMMRLTMRRRWNGAFRFCSRRWKSCKFFLETDKFELRQLLTLIFITWMYDYVKSINCLFYIQYTIYAHVYFKISLY